MSNLLSVLILLPLICAGFLSCFRFSDNTTKMSTLLISVVELALASYMLVKFPFSEQGFHFVESYLWIVDPITYSIGVDGISILFVWLTCFLIPICIFASWHGIKSNVTMYMVLILMLESFLIGSFVSLDIILFYVFFESCIDTYVLYDRFMGW